MRTLDLGALEMFRAVVREGGVIRAATKLHRVQSNITTRIKQLEQRLGVALFRRQGRALALTPAENAAPLIERVQTNFYRPRNRNGLTEGAVMVSTPGDGLSAVQL